MAGICFRSCVIIISYFRNNSYLMKKVVISVGGSVMVPSLESQNISGYSSVLKELSGKCRIWVVVGGGGEARRYIGVCRTLDMDEASSDEIGIMVTRINASLLIGGLSGAAYPGVAQNYYEALEYSLAGKIVVMGGVTPAQTTDAVSAVLAERVGADLLVNATAVDGIYSADPKKDPHADKYDRITPGKLMEIISHSGMGAGANNIIDMVACKVLERSGIPMLVLNGRDPGNLKKAIVEGIFDGTIVSEKEIDPLPL